MCETIKLGTEMRSLSFRVTDAQKEFIDEILVKVDASKKGDALFKLCQYYAKQVEHIDFTPEQDSYRKIIGCVKPEEVEVKEISLKLARQIIVKNHYSHAWPHNNIIALGYYAGNKLLGVLCYGLGAAKNLIPSVCEGVSKDEGLELTRLFSFDWGPKNIESYMISQSFKYLQANFPKIKVLVSFADPSEGHQGTIYQATNWIYTGKSKGANFYKVNDRVTHPRTFSDLPERVKERIKSDPKNKVWKEGKHRYVYLLGSKKQRKALRKSLKLPVLPYPKCDAKGEKKSEVEEIIGEGGWAA